MQSPTCDRSACSFPSRTRQSRDGSCSTALIAHSVGSTGGNHVPEVLYWNPIVAGLGKFWGKGSPGLPACLESAVSLRSSAEARRGRGGDLAAGTDPPPDPGTPWQGSHVGGRVCRAFLDSPCCSFLPKLRGAAGFAPGADDLRPRARHSARRDRPRARGEDGGR